MATVVTGLAASLSLQSAAYLQGLNAAAMATTTAAARMTRSFGTATAAANAATAAVARQAAVANAANARMGAGFVQTGKNVTAMANSFRGLFAATLIIGAAKQVADYADAWQNARNKLAAAEQIAGVQGRSMAELNKIATATRAPIEDIVDLYAKLIRTASGVVKSEEDIAQITKTVAEGFKAGGASTLEQVNGIRQLAQALGSGILQGDELRSIRENAPLIAKAIADELNTTVAGLKKLGAEGKITSEIIARAIIKSQDDIHAAFLKTNPTIAESFTILNNAVGQWIDKQNQASGASRAFAVSLTSVANNLDRIMSFAGDVSGLNAMVTLFNNLKGVLSDIQGLFGKQTAIVGWGSTIVRVVKDAVLNIFPFVTQLRAINGLIEKIRGKAATTIAQVSSPPHKGMTGGDFGFGGFGGGVGGDPSGESAKAAKKALEDHRKLIGEVGSAYEQYRVKLEEIKEANYTTADATRANALALKEYQDNLDKQQEAIGLPLTAMQKYEASLRDIAFAEQQWNLSSDIVFKARTQAMLEFANTALGAAGAMTGALTQLFKDNKAIAIANAVINTAEAITSALKNPPGPPFSFVYAAAAAAAGAAQIATILSAKPGGGKTPSIKGSGGGKGSANVSSGNEARTPAPKGGAGTTNTGQTAINITLQGEGGFSREQVRSLIAQINTAVGDGAVLKVAQ